MADAIGLAASVLQLVQVAWTVTRGLYELADEVGSAGESIRIFTSEFDFFIHTLDHLGHALETSILTRRAENAISDIVDITSVQIMVPFRQLLDKLKPLLLAWRDSPNRMRQLGRRLQWAFSYKNKILLYRGALSELKANMTLFLQVIALRQDQQPLVHFLLRESIETNMLALQGNTSSATPHISMQGSSAAMRPSGMDPMPSHPSASTSRALAITDEGATLGDTQNRTAQLHTNFTTDIDDGLPQGDLDDSSQIFADIPMLVDDSAGHTAQITEEQMELWAAVRTVKKKFKRVVEDSLTGMRAPQSSTNPNITGSASLSSPSGTQAAQSDNNLSATMSMSPSNLSDPIPLASPKPPEIPMVGVDESIYFQDSFGDVFEIPLKLISTYRAMVSFIQGEYKQAGEELYPPRRWRLMFFQDRLRMLLRSIEYEQFSIVDAVIDSSAESFKFKPVPGSRPILPVLWEAQVRAGSAVILVLDHPNLSIRGPRGPSHARIRNASLNALRAAKRENLRVTGDEPDDSSLEHEL